jgi:hypothetical protein
MKKTSYNIDNFKVKKLENFKILYCNFDKKVFGNPEFDYETNEIKLKSNECEVCEFKGTLSYGFIELNKISIYGEGSGYFMHEIGNELLKKSTGTLIARLVWESGDTVEKMTIIDGIKKIKKL